MMIIIIIEMNIEYDYSVYARINWKIVNVVPTGTLWIIIHIIIQNGIFSVFGVHNLINLNPGMYFKCDLVIVTDSSSLRTIKQRTVSNSNVR